MSDFILVRRMTSDRDHTKTFLHINLNNVVTIFPLSETDCYQVCYSNSSRLIYVYDVEQNLKNKLTNSKG